MGISRYFNPTLSTLLLLCINKAHLVHGLSTTLTNHMDAWAHMCKDDGYCSFTCLYPVVISTLISVSEYWHKYPALKLFSISPSSALILLCIIKNNFNRACCPGSNVTGTLD